MRSPCRIRFHCVTGLLDDSKFNQSEEISFEYEPRHRARASGDSRTGRRSGVSHRLSRGHEEVAPLSTSWAAARRRREPHAAGDDLQFCALLSSLGSLARKPVGMIQNMTSYEVAAGNFSVVKGKPGGRRPGTTHPVTRCIM
jgi:hypothetical protein